MKEKEDENHFNNETCQIGDCGCSVRYIGLGIAVIILIMSAAIIFGN